MEIKPSVAQKINPVNVEKDNCSSVTTKVNENKESVKSDCISINKPKTDPNLSNYLSFGENKICEQIYPVVLDVSKEVKNGLGKAIMGGAKVKGAIFGAQYLAAGAIVGAGYEFKLLKFVPDIAVKTPALLGATSKFSRIGITALAAGGIGLAIGVAKGASDGFLAGITDSKTFAMTSLALTTGLITLPMLKSGKLIGTVAIVSSTASGAYYGAKLFDHAKQEKINK